MNNYYKSFIYLLIFIPIFTSLYGSNPERDLIISNKDNFKSLCTKLEEFDKDITKLKNLNAYDRSEEKIKINNLKKKFLSGDFIIKLASTEFELGDYNFSDSSFEINNIKLSTSISINLNKPVTLNVKKENAKMIAAKKELGILDLYIKVKLQGIKDLSCDKDMNIKIKPQIYEYFFMCARSNNIIDYEILHENKDKFIKDPFIELENLKKKKLINRIFYKLERRIQSCKIRFNGFGTKIYEINISTEGEKKIINKNSYFNNHELEECISKEVQSLEFPGYESQYKVYFSIVLSNLD